MTPIPIQTPIPMTLIPFTLILSYAYGLFVGLVKVENIPNDLQLSARAVARILFLQRYHGGKVVSTTYMDGGTEEARLFAAYASSMGIIDEYSELSKIELHVMMHITVLADACADALREVPDHRLEEIDTEISRIVAVDKVVFLAEVCNTIKEETIRRKWCRMLIGSPL